MLPLTIEKDETEQETPEGCVRLYCYDGEAGTDAHAVQIAINRDDLGRYQDARSNERVRRYEFGVYVELTDQLTGDRYKVASAPCGLGCHCAAVAVKL